MGDRGTLALNRRHLHIGVGSNSSKQGASTAVSTQHTPDVPALCFLARMGKRTANQKAAAVGHC